MTRIHTPTPPSRSVSKSTRGQWPNDYVRRATNERLPSPPPLPPVPRPESRSPLNLLFPPRYLCLLRGFLFFRGGGNKSCGRDELVRLLLSEGADVTQTNRHGESPLHYAAAGGHEVSPHQRSGKQPPVFHVLFSNFPWSPSFSIWGRMCSYPRIDNGFPISCF